MSGRPQALARAVTRPWLRIKERKRRKTLGRAFETVKEQAAKSQQRGFVASSTLFNIALYILTAERDIQSLKIDALTHPDEWTRKLCARVILLTIYEWDMDKVSGAAFKNALELAGVSAGPKAEAIKALRSMRVVQRKARQQFGVLRNTTIAHRDADALAQCKAIDELNVDDVFRVTTEFYNAAGLFTDVLPKLISEAGDMSGLLHQWTHGSGKRNDQS